MKNLDYGTISHLIEDLEETFDISRNSGSDIVSILTLMKQDHKQCQPRKSIHEPIPHH